MPSFHHSIAVLPFRSVVPLWRSVVPLTFFRSVPTVAVAGENGNAGNVFPYNIGMKWPERWLVVHLWQNGKNRIRSCCYGTAVTAQRQVETATVQWNFLRKQRNSYGAYVILTEFA